jgi:hypothetical protein
MKVHRPELADVFRTHEKEFLARWRSVLSRPQLRALRAIRDCRTAALGGHLQKCDRCGHRVILLRKIRITGLMLSFQSIASSLAVKWDSIAGVRTASSLMAESL